MINTNNKTILTDAIQAIINGWTLARRAHFSSYMNSVKNAIYNDNQYPTEAAKVFTEN